MRKFVIAGFALFLFLCLVAPPARAQENSAPGKYKYAAIGLLGGLTFMQDEVFRELYGKSALFFGGELAFRFPLRGPHGVDVSVGGTRLSTSGKTSYTEEELSLRLTNYSFSLCYSFSAGQFTFFLGPGMSYVIYKEKYPETFPRESITGNETGVHISGGGTFHLSFGLSLKAYFKYSMAETAAEGFRVNLGGTEWGLGVVYRFRL